MKLNSTLAIFIVASASVATIFLSNPFLNHYRSVVRDCVETKPERRTQAQKQNCKPLRGPVAVIIPGVL